jgi:exodeoxyribonuclease V alpha subunit
MSPGFDAADALARGLAAHVQRWATARGAPAGAAHAAASAAQALSLATGDGHVCVWLADLAALTALTAPAADTTAHPALPADATAWRQQLQASRVVGSPAAPDNQPLVLDDDGRLYLHRHFDLERRLARRLLQSAAPLPVDAAADAATAAQLARLFRPDGAPAAEPDWQMLAAALALRGRLTVVSGGPGTGKTTTVVNLLACLLARTPDARVVLAAPTGKAAARLAEALRQRAGHLPPALQARLPTSATTVHRLLGVRPGRGGVAGAGEQAFEHHAGHPLALDLLVLDEASMLDLALATRLLEAVPLHARIVLLGDKDQLAAVESGAVFAELSADPRLSAEATAHLAQLCGLPATLIRPAAPTAATATATATAAPGVRPGVLADSVVWFQRNYRFGRDSGIGRLAADTLAGQPAAVLATLRGGQAGDGSALQWLDDAGAQPAAATLAAVTDGYAPYVQACRSALAAGTGADDTTAAALHAAFNRFRVLCALRDGPRGVAALNDGTSRRLRQAITGAAGDARTPWFAGRPVMVLRNDPALKLFNGDIGITLPGPDGAWRVVFPAAGDGGGWRALAPARLPAHETAWAMTVHKAQGSEFDAVLLLLPAQRSRVLSRELVYTAITRARQQVQVAAGADVLAAAVQASSQRHAGLLARLQDLRGG